MAGARGAWWIVTGLLLVTGGWAQPANWQPLRFEAEDVSEPQDAWVKDRIVPGKWHLWTTDPGGEKRWSGGAVLQAPAVTADRTKSEDGVPPLHTVIKGIPAGTYDVEVKVARTVGISRDGKEWRPFTGGFIERGLRLDGTFELWVDDRYKTDPPGPCYYDCVILHPVPPLERGFYNPGFDLGPADKLVGWQFSSRDGATAAVVPSDRPDNGRCLRVQDAQPRQVYAYAMPWTLSSNAAVPVKPGESWVLRAWVKATANPMLMVRVDGLKEGKFAQRFVGSAHASGAHGWREISTCFTVPEGIDALVVMVQGREATDVCLDGFSIERGTLPKPAKRPVNGWARQRVTERLDRGLIAAATPSGTYLSWRLLPRDSAEAAFDVYRHEGNAPPVKLNPQPLTRTTDYLGPPTPAGARYTVRRIGDRGPDEAAVIATADAGAAYWRVPLAEKVTPSRVAVGDLDGDGRYDYVIKYPGHDIWCWNEAGPNRWERSKDTYKIEAYTADGKRLWRNDLGWAIEQGLWYSPYTVADLNGDGRAEVAVKIGEGDPREPDGRVINGAEYVAIWDGQTGQEIARAPWPGREGFETYDHFCRHFLTVAYLDGRTPCLLVQRGNYTRVIVDAYQLRGGRLEKLWRYDNQEYGSQWWGQGAHFTQVGDVDGDGRDEVILGCVALDDDGTPLWSVGKGHPDYVFMGQVDPRRPGFQVFLGLEPPQKSGGNILVDAATGKTIWELPVPTVHVGVEGMCSDIDPTSPGLESQALDVNAEKRPAHCWLWSADGRVLREASRSIGSPTTAWWDADLQREIVRGAVFDFDGGPVSERLAGSALLVADLFGDWREEIVTAAPGELRIYTTRLPATDRRTTLMADPLYRGGITQSSMGYPQTPLTSVCLEAVSPGLNLTAMPREDGTPVVRVVVSAPLKSAVKGQLTLTADQGRPEPAAVAIDLAPGERQVLTVTLGPLPAGQKRVVVSARLVGAGLLLTGQVPVVDRRAPVGAALVEAEQFAAQGGGAVRVRSAAEKAGVHGGACFSHWLTAGHWLQWQLKAPAGRYHLLFRYCCQGDAVRTLNVNGQALTDQRFRTTGGFGERAEEWDSHVAGDAGGHPLVVVSDGQPVTVRMEARTTDAGLNLDYLTLVPVGEK